MLYEREWHSVNHGLTSILPSSKVAIRLVSSRSSEKWHKKMSIGMVTMRDRWWMAQQPNKWDHLRLVQMASYSRIGKCGSHSHICLSLLQIVCGIWHSFSHGPPIMWPTVPLLPPPLTPPPSFPLSPPSVRKNRSFGTLNRICYSTRFYN